MKKMMKKTSMVLTTNRHDLWAVPNSCGAGRMTKKFFFGRFFVDFV